MPTKKSEMIVCYFNVLCDKNILLPLTYQLKFSIVKDSATSKVYDLIYNESQINKHLYIYFRK